MSNKRIDDKGTDSNRLKTEIIEVAESDELILSNNLIWRSKTDTLSHLKKITRNCRIRTKIKNRDIEISKADLRRQKENKRTNPS